MSRDPLDQLAIGRIGDGFRGLLRLRLPRGHLGEVAGGQVGPGHRLAGGRDIPVGGAVRLVDGHASLGVHHLVVLLGRSVGLLEERPDVVEQVDRKRAPRGRVDLGWRGRGGHDVWFLRTELAEDVQDTLEPKRPAFQTGQSREPPDGLQVVHCGNGGLSGYPRVKTPVWGRPQARSDSRSIAGVGAAPLSRRS
ncbi:MAG: hypothetical protein ABIZ71_11165 [Gemmatimonadales bacterium]